MPSAPAQVAETAALEQERPQRRPAPLWLRLALLILAGVALAFPVLQAAWESLFGSDRSQIRHVARAFFEALKGPDLRAANQLVVPGASVPDGVMVFHWFGALRSGFVECDVDAVEIHNVYARAIFTCRLADPAAPDRQVDANNPNRLLGLALARRLDGEKGILYLERIDGKWRAYSIALSSLLFPPGPLSPPRKEVGSQPQARLAGITNPEPIDFRKKQKSFQLPVELAPQTQFFKGLAAVDADTTVAAWKTDINVDRQPASLVLKTLASELGLVFQPGPETTALGKALAEPVSVRSQGQSRLQAIEEVCRQVKVRPQYLAGVLMVQSGPRAGPTTTAGPFRIAVEGVREFSESATATVSLEVIAPGLPAAVNAFSNGDDQVLTIVDISEQGRDLYHRENQAFFPISNNRLGRTPAAPAVPVGGTAATVRPIWEDPEPEPEPLVLQTVMAARDIPLRHLFRDLDTISELRGRVRLLLPTQVDTLVFAALRPGATQQAGDISLAFVKSEASVGNLPSSTLTFSYQGDQDRQLWWMGVDQTGLAVKTARAQAAKTIRLSVPPSATAVHFKVVKVQPQSWDFVLRDVPLKQRPPQKLEPALFPGHDAPLTVDVERIDRNNSAKPRVVLSLVNHCQKDVERIALLMSYLGENGEELKQRQHVVAAYANFNHRLLVQVSGHSRGACTVEDAELPPETQTVRVTVQRVGFVDGMSWSVPGK